MIVRIIVGYFLKILTVLIYFFTSSVKAFSEMPSPFNVKGEVFSRNPLTINVMWCYINTYVPILFLTKLAKTGPDSASDLCLPVPPPDSVRTFHPMFIFLWHRGFWRNTAWIVDGWRVLLDSGPDRKISCRISSSGIELIRFWWNPRLRDHLVLISCPELYCGGRLNERQYRWCCIHLTDSSKGLLKDWYCGLNRSC